MMDGRVEGVVRMDAQMNSLVMRGEAVKTRVEALKLGRRFYGCEIKDEYIAAARNNLKTAMLIEQDSRRTLFDMA